MTKKRKPNPYAVARTVKEINKLAKKGYAYLAIIPGSTHERAAVLMQREEK